MGSETTTYAWDDAGRLITTTVGVNVSRVYTYSQSGDLTAVLVDNLLTTFVYDGDGRRLQMSVAGEVTTYTLDYAGGFRVLLEEGGAFSDTKHYLYGLACIGELVDADEPESEWRYYHQDGNHLVRQTTNMAATVTLAWTYSPEGAVLLGEKGPVTNLGCGDLYDWSTGLIFKNGRYFDPRTGIWIALSGLVMYQAGWLPDGKRRKWNRGKKQLFLIFLLLIMTLASCSGGTPNQVQCPPVSQEMPDLPSGRKILLFGGAVPGGNLNPAGPPTQDQLPFFHQIATDSFPYPGRPLGKQGQANSVPDKYLNEDRLLIGFSAGADAALIYAYDYMNTHPEDKENWSIKGIALLNPNLSGNMDDDRTLGQQWKGIMERLLDGGTHIYYLDDDGEESDTPPMSMTGKGQYFYDDDRDRRHYDPEKCCGDATNNSVEVRDKVISWFNSR